MSEPTLSDLSAKLDGITNVLNGHTKILTEHSKILSEHSKTLADLKVSVAGTDAVVTALYAELVGNRPNLRDRLAILEANVHKLIELTPSAPAELQQPVYDA